MDLTNFIIVKEDKIKKTPYKKKEKKEKVKEPSEYIIIVKEKNVFYEGIKVVIKVKVRRDNYTEAVVTCKPEQYLKNLTKLKRHYRKFGTIDILDLRDDNNQGSTRENQD